ncbi:MAG: NUDIX domain-containing protein [Bacteroidota bacterium]
MTRKVFAYLTRMYDGKLQLLVFRKLQDPKAGIQVPGGTVEYDEREEEALYRQIEEESGLIHLRFIGKLDRHVLYRGCLKNSEERHFYHVQSLEEPPGRWKHTVESFSQNDGEQLEYFWIGLDEAKRCLAREQDRSLPALENHLRHRRAG